jgi:signal transduction histidine kinase
MKKTYFLRCFLPYIAVLLLYTGAMAQDSASKVWVDISKIGLVKSISPNVSTAYINHKVSLSEAYASSLKFTPGIIHKKTIPNDFVTQTGLLRFHVCNNADTTLQVYFFPGFYYKRLALYRDRDNKLEKLPSIVPANPDSIGYRLFSIAPHDSATIVAELGFVKTYINSMRPRLINPVFLDSFVSEIHSAHNDSEVMTYIFCGLLLMMILFSTANFLQGANREFLYYSGYAFFLGLMLLTKAMFTYHATQLSYFLESYLDFIMQDAGILFYMIFMQKYLATRTQHPFLHRLYNSGIVMLLVSIISYSFFHYFTDNFIIENLIENGTKALLLLMNLVFLIYSIKYWKEKLLRYLFWGNLLLFVFSLFSQLLILDSSIVRPLPGLFRSALFYYEVGLFLELVFFLMALNYKNKMQLIAQARERERLKADNLMKEYEKELAVFKAQQQERERISADMHDELGSGMTAIRLMSEIARRKMKGEMPVEIEKISQSADEVLNKMNAIIWSMNSGNDTMDNLVSYIRSYSLEYF